MHICPTNYSGFRRTEYPGGEDISTGEAESDDRWNIGSSACLDVHTPPLPLPAVPFRVAKRLVVRDAAWVHVAMGTLVDAPSVKPSAHIFVGDKAPWFEITDDLPQYEGHVT
jgi:hypothetical protein